MSPPTLPVSTGLEIGAGAEGRTDLLDRVAEEHKVVQALI